MPTINFFGQNIHFAICLFAALVLFAVFWLYFDAWAVKRQPRGIFEWVGFLLLALSFVITATVTEQLILGYSSVTGNLQTTAFILAVLGFGGIIAGQLIVPLQKRPKMKGLDKSLFVKDPDQEAHNHPTASRSIINVSAISYSSFAGPIHCLLPIGALAVAAVYWRRATTGLERHLRPVAVAFGFIFVYELLSLASIWQNTTNPSVARLIAAFGWLWFIDHALLLIGVVILGRWVWQYLTRRFVSQLFMVFTTITVAVFLVTAVTFTFLLVSNVQKSNLDNLETAASVLNYAVSNKQSESLAKTATVAENPSVATAVFAKDHDSLVSLTATFLVDQKQTSLIIADNSGEVLLRAEDPANWGDSISSDTLFQRSLIGQAGNSIDSKEGVLAPVIYIKSAVPIYDSQHQIVGVAVGSLAIDNAFVDGIKRSTNLDSSVYAGDTLSATTFLGPDGSSRTLGLKETDKNIKSTVLGGGLTFKGVTSILNRDYQVVFAPLKDADNVTVGMLFIGQPRDNVLKTAGHSIELTFIITAILAVISVAPAYLIARGIARQVA